MKSSSIKHSESKSEIYKLPDLPFSYSDLEPLMSEETLKFHHDKHHKNYIDKLNKLISKDDASPIEELIQKFSPGDPIFNNAAQAWNHEFFWNCLKSPHTPEIIPAVLKKLFEDSFGSIENLKKQFNETATKGFGSGWTWLEKNPKGKLEVNWRPDAETPIQIEGQIPILVCDFWEHAYYIDHRNDKEAYLKSFWDLVHWSFVFKCYSNDEVP